MTYNNFIEAVAQFQKGNPIINMLFEYYMPRYPELNFFPIKSVEKEKYYTLWDKTEKPSKFNLRNQTPVDLSKMGGGFTCVNGFPKCCGMPEWEVKEQDLFLHRCSYEYPEDLENRIDDRLDIENILGTLDNAILSKAIKKTLSLHKNMIWHGTAIDPNGYAGIYETSKLYYPAIADFNDPNKNAGAVGTPGEHTSIWLIRNSNIEDQGIGLLTKSDKSFPGTFDREKRVYRDEPPAEEKAKGKCGRWLVNNEISHYMGLHNQNPYNAIRIYGISSDDTQSQNCLVDDYIWEVESVLPEGIDINEYSIWMSKKSYLNLTKKLNAKLDFTNLRDHEAFNSARLSLGGLPVYATSSIPNNEA